MTFVIAFLIGGILVLSSIANFGILSRQRTLIFPAMLVLFAIPPRRPASRGKDEDHVAAPEMASAAA
jgi:hypothetical protein